jgi:hypothetical protein
MVLIVLTILMVFLLATTAQASTRQPFHLAKVCPSPDNPMACDIFEAVPFDVLIGGQIVYTDHAYFTNPTGRGLEIATIHLTTGSGKDQGEAVGHIRWLVDSGKFTIGNGSGSLAGLHADGTIEYMGTQADERPWFLLDGTYHVDP